MTAGATSDVVFLLDVDNTLLDNDRIIVDLRRHLECSFGLACAEHYWTIFEALRTKLTDCVVDRWRAGRGRVGDSGQPQRRQGQRPCRERGDDDFLH